MVAQIQKPAPWVILCRNQIEEGIDEIERSLELLLRKEHSRRSSYRITLVNGLSSFSTQWSVPSPLPSQGLFRAMKWMLMRQDFTCMWHLYTLSSSTFFFEMMAAPSLIFQHLLYPSGTCWLVVVCPTEILAFNKAIADFQAIGAEVIVSSTDSEFLSTRASVWPCADVQTHLAWSQMNRKEGGLGPDLKLTMVRSKLVELRRLTLSDR